MSAIRSEMLLALTLACIACTADNAVPGWVTRDSAGIVIVENDHTRPLWRPGESWTLSAEPVVQIGRVEGDTTEQLYRVVDSRRLADGTIAVVNAGTAEVRLFDAQGRYVRTIGRRGDGPGEFRSPWAVHQLPGDSLLVIDLYRSISIFDGAGKFIRRFQAVSVETGAVDGGGEGSGGGGEPVGMFGDGTLLFRNHYRETPPSVGLYRNRIRMLRYGIGGEFLGSLGDFDDQTIKASGMYAFGAWAKEAPGDSTMWYSPGGALDLSEITFDGRVIRIARLDRPNRPVTEADIVQFKDRYLARVRGNPSEQAMNRRIAEAEFAPEYPAHFDILTDDAGNVWVQEYIDWNERVPRRWSVFDVRGRYLGDVEVPAGLAVQHIGADFILGRWTDELDVEYIQLYRIHKPAG